MLQLKNVKKNYVTGGSVVEALKGVSLEFRENEFVSILGASGCGKTTLLNIIGGLDQYTSGDLIIRGVSTKHYKDRDWDVYRNHRIGFVFQSYNLIPHQTVLGNVELALTIAGLSKSERKKRAAEALERVGLKEQMHKRPNQLSGGQMQRVAIARALVNNPEILLADEPTGALDSTTSVQIMELIREIAGERLVIMVTHNPELAERYSTRIVRLSDGLVVSDSNPYDSSVEREELVEKLKEKGWTNEKVKAWKEAKKKREKKEKGIEKASMSFSTALGLSARNLRAKKGRTAVTSFAGSIGIISVCLVLALSNGFNQYIVQTEEDMLSYYPLQVTETSIDINSIMNGMSDQKEMPKLSELGDKVYVNSFLTKMAKGMTVTNNISDEYLDYIEAMNPDWYSAIHYGYGVNLSDNIFTSVVTSSAEAVEKTETMSLSELKSYYTRQLETFGGEQYGQMAYLVDYLGSVVNVMPDTDDLSKANAGKYILDQYDVFGDFPEKSNEAVIVVGENNDMTDLLLAQLGFISESQFLELFEQENQDDQTEKEDMLIPFADIYEKQFTLFYNDAVYLPETDSTAKYPFKYQGSRGLDGKLTAEENEGVNVKITGVLRLKDGLTYGCLSSGLNVTEQLIEEYIAKNMQSAIVRWMQSDGAKMQIPYDNPETEETESVTLYFSPAEHLNGMYRYVDSIAPKPDVEIEIDRFIAVSSSQAIRTLGGNDRPSAISFYPTDFDAKEEMVKYLDWWNENKPEEDKITYTDTVGLMMGLVQTMLNAVTYVLVAFTAISLVVSSVMIGIITYVSVVERTKEIGVLRSLGARKRDIKNLFNAETFIIGLSAGLFGVAVTYLLSFGINAILSPLTGIATLASLPVKSAVIMVTISVILTLISGLIPAKSAAKKDPVIALRTE
ncbi:MAG: ABC transporter ATP-binding protein/permease [Clostridia bacterium]|nr:ABC transporter ATP-binding protein/permease [Clostridia bacterium]